MTPKRNSCQGQEVGPRKAHTSAGSQRVTVDVTCDADTCGPPRYSARPRVSLSHCSTASKITNRYPVDNLRLQIVCMMMIREMLCGARESEIQPNAMFRLKLNKLIYMTRNDRGHHTRLERTTETPCEPRADPLTEI